MDIISKKGKGMIAIYWTAIPGFRYPGDLYVKYSVAQSVYLIDKYKMAIKQNKDWLCIQMFPKYALCIKQSDYDTLFGALKIGMPVKEVYAQCEVIHEDPKINKLVFNKLFNIDLISNKWK